MGSKEFDEMKIIAIGYLGDKTCYVNVDREEAIARYLSDNDLEDLEGIKVTELEVADTFHVYEIWE